jgi:hypothetical protein
MKGRFFVEVHYDRAVVNLCQSVVNLVNILSNTETSKSVVTSTFNLPCFHSNSIPLTSKNSHQKVNFFPPIHSKPFSPAISPFSINFYYCQASQASHSQTIALTVFFKNCSSTLSPREISAPAWKMLLTCKHCQTNKKAFSKLCLTCGCRTSRRSN